MTEWIKWDGGECPIHPGQVFELEWRDGMRSGPVEMIEPGEWVNTGDQPDDIIKYRLITSRAEIEEAKKYAGKYAGGSK